MTPQKECKDCENNRKIGRSELCRYHLGKWDGEEAMRKEAIEIIRQGLLIKGDIQVLGVMLRQVSYSPEMFLKMNQNNIDNIIQKLKEAKP